ADGNYTVVSRATDVAGNVETPGAGNTYTVDAPDSAPSVSFPADASKLRAATYTAGCSTAGTDDVCGTASDTGSGVQAFEVSVQRASDSHYWNGTDFPSASQVWRPAPSATPFPYSTLSRSADGNYTVVSRATDVAGNVETPGAGNT